MATRCHQQGEPGLGPESRGSSTVEGRGFPMSHVWRVGAGDCTVRSNGLWSHWDPPLKCFPLKFSNFLTVNVKHVEEYFNVVFIKSILPKHLLRLTSQFEPGEQFHKISTSLAFYNL